MALEQLTSDLSCISNWGRGNMVVFNASKNEFLHLSTRHNLPHNYNIFFQNTQLKRSYVLNILGIPFSRDLSLKDSLLLFLNKLLGGYVFCGKIRITSRHPC